MKTFKNTIQAIFILALLSIGSFIAPTEAQAKKPVKQIPTAGFTTDGKYSIYNLEGELEDLNYFSPSDNTLWNPGDLPGRMKYIKAEDVNKGRYVCVWVCKDKTANAIVGLNPNYGKR